jgi:hypothetical protein
LQISSGFHLVAILRVDPQLDRHQSHLRAETFVSLTYSMRRSGDLA